MKRFLLALLFFCAGVAAGPDDLLLTQRNSLDTGNITRIPTHPNSDGLLWYNFSTLLPEWVTLGSNLSITGGVLNAASVAQVNTDWNAVSGVAKLLNKPSFATVAFTGNYADLSGTPARSFSYTTRSLNTCFQVSASRDALVTYGVDIATTLSLTTGQQGTVYLETYTNSSCSAGTQEITRFVNGNTGTLTIGLALTQNVTGTLTGVIPAGSYLQLRTQNNTGTPTFTARPGQETLL